MAEENKDVPFAEQQNIGSPPGVTNADVHDGHSRQGNPEPKVSNEPPAKVLTAEEKAAADKATTDAATKAATDKAEADKVAADKIVADKLAADEAAKKVTDPNEPTEYLKYDEPGADSVVEIFKEAGVAPAEGRKFFEKAVASGKLEDIDVAGLEAKVGKDKAKLIIIGATQHYNSVAAKVAKVTEAVHTELGGKANLDTVVAWAQAKEIAEPAFKEAMDTYRQMFNGNPISAKLAAKELKAAYNSDPKNKTLDTTVVEGNKANLTGVQGITRKDYIEQLKVAEGKGDKAEVARLNQARKAGMAAGI